MEKLDWLLFASRFEAGRSVVESSLNINNTELSVLAFPMGCHGPQETYAVTRNRDIGMESSGHQYGIAVSHHSHQFRILSVVIHKLNGKCLWHMEIYVPFLKQVSARA